MNKFIYLLVTLTFFSCLPKHVEYSPPVFATKQNISIEDIGSPFEILPYGLRKIGDYFIANHMHLNKKVFHLYSAKDYQYVASFGDIGNSRKELNLSINSFHVKDNICQVFVTNRPYIIEYDLSWLMNGVDSIPINTVRANKMLGFFVYVASNNNCLEIFGSNKNRIVLYDHSFNALDSSNYYSPLEIVDRPFEIDSEFKMIHMNRTSYKVSPDGKHLLSEVNMGGAVYEIFKITDNRIVPTITKYFHSPKVNDNNEIEYQKDPDIEPRHSSCTNNFIYFSYKKREEAINQYLKVMDWEGKPIKEYNLGVDIMRTYIEEGDSIGYVVYKRDDDLYQLAKFSL